jgi:hypothetical protein
VRGAKRTLGGLEGVRNVEAEIGTFHVTITPGEKETLDLAAIRPALQQGGLNVRRVYIVADGKKEGSHFRIDGWPDAYPLDSGAADLAEGHVRLRAIVRISAGVPHLRVVPGE